jgi:hypothetical protein
MPRLFLFVELIDRVAIVQFAEIVSVPNCQWIEALTALETRSGGAGQAT